ncbi:mitochondrial carrier [Ascoidea rubescens DSM 1968]|uniref:Mitochondrial carrier n=1 Tax=Ascoidea rubescens DSM 1968 TaxID=1344418 RepID=A0A1D2VA19_9ASCO|nr:mitochondrial carrier [Ascoidea rubescens DSM 1968]ODV58405.1 mitochondrial carrier [Ascoidea rubescens DSM 1968]
MSDESSSHSYPHRKHSKGLGHGPPSRDLQIESNLITAIIAGVGASIGQTTLTYPFESLKTIQQLHKSTPTSLACEYPSKIQYYFAGLGALNLGNALKASSRFIVFNSASKFMANDNGKTTAPRVVVAGMMTGFIESLWIIPFENIKTLMVENAVVLNQREQDQLANKANKTNKSIKFNKIEAEVKNLKIKQASKNSNPASKSNQIIFNSKKSEININDILKLNNSYNTAIKKWNKNPSRLFYTAVQELYQVKGLRGFTRASGITLLRQCANSAVRFGTYHMLQQLILPNPNESLSSHAAFAIGVISSGAVVGITQPLDVIKTRLQSKNGAGILYRNSLDCCYKIFTEEGAKKFWSGWFPRFLKVSTSGGITFIVYNSIENDLKLLMREKPFQAE